MPYGDKIVTISVLEFAISTIAWSFYGNRSVVYLFGEKINKPYSEYMIFVFIGGIAELETIWAFGDAAWEL